MKYFTCYRYLCVWLLLAAGPVFGQQPTDDLEARFRSSSGLARVQLANQLASQKLEKSPGLAIRYASQALDEVKKIEQDMKAARRNPDLLEEDQEVYIPSGILTRAEANSNNLLGRAYRKQNDRKKAIEHFRRGYRFSRRAGYREGESLAESQLRALDAGLGLGNLLDESLKSTGVRSTVKDATAEINVKYLESVAASNEEKGRFQMAIDNYSKTIRFYQDLDDSLKLAEIYARIASLQNELGETQKALVYYDLSDKMQGVKTINTVLLDKSLQELESARLALEAEMMSDSTQAILFPDEDWLVVNPPNIDPDFEQSPEFLESYERLREQLVRVKENRQTDSLVRAILIQEQKDKIANLQRDREVQLLKMEQTEAEIQRREAIQYALIAGLVLILILAGVLIALFVIKRRSHNRLAKAYKKLDTAHEQLKATQIQLVEAEKMASLGQLTAGIAHEINNPLNFISGNIPPLKRDIDDLMQVIGAYEKAGSDIEQLKEANRIGDELEVEFVREEIDFLLQGMQEGANRTAEIVQGLKDFSRMGEDMPKPFSLHEGINHTLVLLKPDYESRITIEKQYAENLPEPVGLAGKINQVLVNVLNNAIESISGTGTITIETRAEKEFVRISIRDTGRGMGPEISKKAFDPFFTTKDVGQGKGLGLAICHGIIQRHQGDIRLDSRPGRGTLVEIELPLEPDTQQLMSGLS